MSNLDAQEREHIRALNLELNRISAELAEDRADALFEPDIEKYTPAPRAPYRTRLSSR